MDKLPKVSIIMPVYNQEEEYLNKAVESVFNQTFKDWELIIVDDGSDEPVNFSEGIPDKVRILRQENKGVASALNKGIKEAKGDWIAWLSSDDIWYPNKLEAQINFATDPKRKVIYSDWYYINEKGEIIRQTKEPEYKNKEEVQFRLCHRFFACGSFVMIHKDVFEKVGNFDETFRGCEDHEMWGRISKEYMFYKCPGILGGYREHQKALRYNLKEDEATLYNRARNKVRENLNYNPKVSVVIAAHNEAKTIGNCICAVSDASAVSEIIVVNDGSTDDTKNIIEALNSKNEKIKVINITRQSGRAIARNRGIELATNNLIATVDGDTVPNRGWLEMLMNILDDNWLDASAGSVKWESPNMGHWKQYVDFYQTSNSTKSIGTVCTLFKKEMLKHLNGFREDITSGEDSDFFMRAQREGFKFIKVRDIIGTHYEYRNFFEWLERHYEYGSDRAEITYHHKDIMKGQYSEEEMRENPPEIAKIIDTLCSLVGTLGFRKHWYEKMTGVRGDKR